MMKPIDWCTQHGKSTNELILVMKERFPKYGHPTNTMANNSEEYGVCLSPQAVAYLGGGRREPKRTRSEKFTFRLTPLDAYVFATARQKRGDNIQDAVEKAVMLYIRELDKDG